MTRLAALMFAVAMQGQSPNPIEGYWRSPGGNSIISIAPCGASLCGTIAWASERAKADSAKTTPQLIGTQILTNLQSNAAGRWQGRLFIPDKNMRVTAKLQLKSPQQLRVSGCAAGKMLCKADVWTRTSAPN